MLSGFVASLSFELGCDVGDVEEKVVATEESEGKVREEVQWYDEGELGDSCCFGTRTVDMGLDCVWKLHGGI